MKNFIKSPFQQIYSERVPEFKDSTGRFVEEVVELALASGMPTGELLNHVMDAIHNEAAKAKQYPSELPQTYNHESVKEEMTDCYLFLEAMFSLYFSDEESKVIKFKAIEKAEGFVEDKKNDKLKFSTSGTFYRIK